MNPLPTGTPAISSSKSLPHKQDSSEAPGDMIEAKRRGSFKNWITGPVRKLSGQAGSFGGAKEKERERSETAPAFSDRTDVMSDSQDANHGKGTTISCVGCIEEETPSKQLPHTTPHNNMAGSSPTAAESANSIGPPIQLLTLEELTISAPSPSQPPVNKRECMVFEIAETELKYVHALSIIVDGYMAGTSNPSPPNMPPAPADLTDRVHIVWGNIRQLYDWHRNTLLAQLSTACYSNSLADLATCFIRHERRFLMYSKYALNVPKADYIIGEQETYFTDLRRALTVKAGLKDLVIEPVQRAMRYQLMLHGLLAHLEKHPEDLTEAEQTDGVMDRLRRALKVMSHIPKEVNDMMQLGKLLDYDTKAHGSITAQGKLLLQATARFYAPGSPTTSKRKEQWKKASSSSNTSCNEPPTECDNRQVFLFEQSLLVAESERTSAVSFIGPRYLFKHFVKGSSMNAVNQEGGECQLQLECTDKSFELVFDSAPTCQLWASTISNLIMDRKDFAKALAKPIDYQKQQLLNSNSGNSAGDATSSSVMGF